MVFTGVAWASGNETNQSFSKVKRTLLEDIYTDYHTTFYCGSTFDSDKNVDHTASGYVPVRNNTRAHRLE